MGDTAYGFEGARGVWRPFPWPLAIAGDVLKFAFDVVSLCIYFLANYLSGKIVCLYQCFHSEFLKPFSWLSVEEDYEVFGLCCEDVL